MFHKIYVEHILTSLNNLILNYIGNSCILAVNLKRPCGRVNAP